MIPISAIPEADVYNDLKWVVTCVVQWARCHLCEHRFIPPTEEADMLCTECANSFKALSADKDNRVFYRWMSGNGDEIKDPPRQFYEPDTRPVQRGDHMQLRVIQNRRGGVRFDPRRARK